MGTAASKKDPNTSGRLVFRHRVWRIPECLIQTSRDKYVRLVQKESPLYVVLIKSTLHTEEKRLLSITH